MMKKNYAGELASKFNFGCKYHNSNVKVVRDNRNCKFWMVELSDGTFWVRTPLREWKVDKFYPVRFLGSDFARLFIARTNRTIATARY
jgi:hypothetical protein